MLDKIEQETELAITLRDNAQAMHNAERFAYWRGYVNALIEAQRIILEEQ